MTDLHLYEDENDFWAVDLVVDPDSQMKVVSIPAKEVRKNALVEFKADILVRGELILFTAHVVGDSIAFVAGTASEDTITDSNSGFADAGFGAGMTLVVEGTANNDGQYKVKEVVAGTLTLESTGDLTDESAGSSFGVHGGTYDG